VSSSGSKRMASKDATVATPDTAIKRLTRAVTLALEEVERLKEEVARMNARSEAMEELLRGVTSGEGGPREMIEKLHIFQEENLDLRRRLDEGREGVDRLLARVKFLEEQS